MSEWQDNYLREENGKWYWYDEGYSKSDSYDTREEAKAALDKYADLIT